MKVVFFGSSDFAVAGLKAVMKEHQVLAVVTQPDRRQGRDLKIGQTPVKIFALNNGLEVFQPEDVNSLEAVSKLKSFNADIFAVISFGQKLSKAILEMPRHGCINVHSSLLPRWRGAAPINWAILSGDKSSGISVMRMNEYMDRGDIILIKETSVNDDDAQDLTLRLAELGAQGLKEAMALIESGKAEFVKQDENKATHARKLKKEDGLISWKDNSAVEIYNQVRGLVPWPCAYTYYEGTFVKILKAVVTDGSAKVAGIPGQVIAVEKDRGIVIAAAKGVLRIEKLQAEGKRAMPAYDFAIGRRIAQGNVWG